MFALTVSAKAITHMPMNEIVRPIMARLEGLMLKRKLEMNTEKIGVVFTRIVAFRIVVSFTADTKNMKWRLSKKLRMRSSFRFFFTRFKLSDFPRTISITARVRQAIIRRQKAIWNVSMFCRNLMKMAAVPKRIPAVMPSVKASFFVLTLIWTPFSVPN